MAAREISGLAGRGELRSTLQDLQADSARTVLPALSVAGLLLILAQRLFRDPLQAALPGLLLFLLPLAFWQVGQLSRAAASWLPVAGVLAAELLLILWGRMDVAVCLLALPVGLATLTAGRRAGVLVASACSLLLSLGPAGLSGIDIRLRVVALLNLWTTLGLIWLAMRPLLTTLEWSWSSHEQSQFLLQRARDYQVQLKQTLADLADANLQLTRLNRLADGLRQAADEARRTKERFVANVSHELRTPLNMILGFSEMILQAPETYGADLPPALLADLAVVQRNSQHLSGLIDDVLDLSQVEAGRMALSKEQVVLADVIASAVAAVRPLFASRGLYLETEIAADLPPILCDRTRIREVILNLLSNAGRFTEQGGVRVRARCEEREVVVSVADTGPGIAADDLSRIFRPFEQLDGSIRRRHGGSGLGLSIGRSFVELHGGRMWLESEQGHGTTFHFSLPLEPVAAHVQDVGRWFSPYWHYEERQRPSLAPLPLVRPRYVVCEAGEVLQRLVRRYLDGAEVLAADGLEEASRLLATAPAQALLVNDALPAAALERLGDGVLPYGTPAIVCSLPGTAEAAGALGASGYLVKPVSREALLGALDRLPARPHTILVVDDEPEALQLFWRMLRSARRGYRVLTATNGRQALQLLREDRPDALLLDLVMPEMDGFQLLQAKNADPALCHIPSIVVSARDPAGQPAVAGSLAVLRGGGLSAPQLLACIEGLSRLLGPVGEPEDPGPQGNRSG